MHRINVCDIFLKNSLITEIFHSQKTFLQNIWSKKFSKKNLIKEIFNSQGIFPQMLDQGNFPQKRTFSTKKIDQTHFSQSRKLLTQKKIWLRKFSTFRKIFHKQVFHNNFVQRRFSTNKDFLQPKQSKSRGVARI